MYTYNVSLDKFRHLRWFTGKSLKAISGRDSIIRIPSPLLFPLYSIVNRLILFRFFINRQCFT